MFLTHLLESYGIDKVIAPPTPREESDNLSSAENNSNNNDNNNGNAIMNNNVEEEEENPFWSVVAPRMKPLSINNDDDDDDQEVREERDDARNAPPAEVFQQQQVTTTTTSSSETATTTCCVHCNKMTPIQPQDIRNSPEHRRVMYEDDYFRTMYEDTLDELTAVTSEKCTLEERLERMMLEIEVLKGEQQQQPKDEATAHLHNQVLTAATDTNHTKILPSFVYATYKALFERVSAKPKPQQQKRKKQQQQSQSQQQQKEGQQQQQEAAEAAVEYSPNLKKIIKILKNDPKLISIRSANMPPLPDGYTLLHAAVHGGNGEVVTYLLEHYVIVDSMDDYENDNGGVTGPRLDLNDRDLQGRTALHICAEMGHVELLSAFENAYSKLAEMEERRLREAEEEEEEEEDEEGLLSVAMSKLNTSDDDIASSTAASSVIATTTPTTTTTTSTPAHPSTRTTTAARSKSKKKRAKSLSPKPPSFTSPTFKGEGAPLDLLGRTPLGYAATSSEIKAKNNREQMEKMLYQSGDRSIVGERTPPRERSGGSFTPPLGSSGGLSNRRVGFHTNDEMMSPPPGSSGLSTTCLSPTPRKTLGRVPTPFHSALSSPMALDTAYEGVTAANSVAWGAAEMPGMRVNMEDAILCHPMKMPPKPASTDNEKEMILSPSSSTMGIFGVFDGHGDGGHASRFISTKLISKLESKSTWNVAYYEMNLDNDATADAFETVFTEACYDLDMELKNDESKPRDGGTTAVVAVVSSQKILVANVGDSRCILVKKGTTSTNDVTEREEEEKEEDGINIEVISMSEDHKPDLPDERARIESAGLQIHTDQIFHDNGEYELISKVKKSDKEMLGVARAFGDYDYKSNEDLSPARQAVVCTPDIVVRDRADGEDMFLILACDGVWDVMSNDDVGLFVTKAVNAATASLTEEECHPVDVGVLASVGDSLLDHCLKQGSTDNMSVLIVALPASGLSFDGKMNASAATTATARALAFE
jgi:serine/threonine protein phosphatase PrpC